jgi:hypothetical protein
VPDLTGARYTVRMTQSDGHTSRIEVQDLAWMGFDSRRWRFKDWPDERLIRTILIAYRPTDPFVDSWFIKEINVDRREVIFSTKAKAIARSISYNYVNATMTHIDGRKEYEQMRIEDIIA